MKHESKVFLATEIKFNFKILILSLILGFVVFLVRAITDGGFAALKDQYQYETNNCLSQGSEKCPEILSNILSNGSENGTLQRLEGEHYVLIIDGVIYKYQDVMYLSGAQLFDHFNQYYSKIGGKPTDIEQRADHFVVRYEQYYLTLQATIKKSFGSERILQSIYFMFLFFLSIIGIRYIILGSKSLLKLTNKYSNQS